MKGSQYQNVWMYVIHELEAAITDCKAGTVGSHWDEAVAFYSGSITLTNPTTNIGQFQYGLAEKRCTAFGTCTSGNSALYKSEVNEKVYKLFATGSGLQSTFQCSAMESVKESLVKQFTVPFIQAIIQYLYLSKTQGLEKQKAELWSFSAALLPLLNYYSLSAAKVLYENSYILNVDTVPLGYAAAKLSLEGAYSAMGITCADVGGYVSATDASGYVTGLAPCTDSVTSISASGSSMSMAEDTYSEYFTRSLIIALAIFVIFFVLFAVIISALFCRGRITCESVADRKMREEKLLHSNDVDPPINRIV